MKDIFTVIRMCYVNFTRAEKLIADYVLQNPETAQEMTISELAKTCGIGETSVFRFCRSIGETGYQGFRARLMQSVAASGAARPAEHAVQMLNAQDGPAELSRKLYAYHVGVLGETCRAIRHEAIGRAAEALLQARNAHFIGFGPSSLIAQAAQERFARLRKYTYFSMDEHMQMMDASILSPEDAALCVACSGEEKSAVYTAGLVKERGATLIGMGRSESASLGVKCDIFLRACMYDDLMMDSALSTQVAQIYLLDVLYACAYNIAHPS